MDFKFVVGFFISLGVYLFILGGIAFFKYLRNKKKVENEDEPKEENQNSDSTTKE